MQPSIIPIDLGENSCSLVVLDAAGKVVMRRRMRRETVLSFCAKLGTCVVAMEACCGAHHLGRALSGQGHEVRLMSPEYVRPHVKAQKNDDRNAEAIAEPASRPTMRFVGLKSEEQLEMQTLHRVRDQRVGNGTSLMNQIRSLLPVTRSRRAARSGQIDGGAWRTCWTARHRFLPRAFTS